MRPLVSIITPTYNSEAFIAQTIASIQAQTLTDWELWVTDDCSTDATVSLLERFAQQDPRIHYMRLDRNSGPGVARDRSIQNATGRYIAFLDADDLWLPEKLQRQIDFMQQHDTPFTFCFYDWIDESGNPMHKRISAPNPLSYRQLFFCNYVGNLTGIYDTDFFGKIPIPPIRKRQDWMIWLTILKQVRRAQPVPESLALYRIRRESVSSSKTRLLKYNYAVYRQFHGYNVLRSLGCMAVFLFTQLVVKPRYAQSLH